MVFDIFRKASCRLARTLSFANQMQVIKNNYIKLDANSWGWQTAKKINQEIRPLFVGN